MITSSKKRTFLLIPSIPTPNGKLHLGHIAGPFLKMDIIKRFNQQVGNEVFLYGGTDVHDSYTVLKASVELKPIEDICWYYHNLINDDLKKMSIEFDFFLNPLDVEYYLNYTNTTQKLFRDLETKGKLVCRTEKYPFSHKQGFLPASFIHGECPICQSKMSGFICEQCGISHKPEEIQNKHYKLNNVEEKNIDSYFLPINGSAILSIIFKIKLPFYMKKILKVYLKEKNDFRITSPTFWGVGAQHGSVFYNYGTFFAYCYLLSDIFCQKQKNLFMNAFTSGTEVETVASFGVDNISTFAIGTLNYALTLGSSYKGFDFYLPNQFMTLNGDKFSTSRNHAIWVDKIKPNVSIDIIRLFLLKNNPDNHRSDFKLSEFIAFYNEMACSLNRHFSLKGGILKKTNESRLRTIYHQNINCMMPENYSGRKIYKQLMAWISCEEEGEVWLKGFSVIAYPVMPNLSLLIWQSVLNQKGIPKFEAFKPQPLSLENLNRISLINNDDIEVG